MNPATARTNVAVALLRFIGNATPQHPLEMASRGATPGATVTATPGLKALARQVLERNARRNRERNTPPSMVLRGPHLGDTPSATAQQDLAEAAAVIEEGAKVPRAWAEAYANLAFPGVGELDTAGRALDAWAVKADALGWRPAELFALATRGEVVALTAEGVSLRNGAVVRHVRRGAK